MIFGPPRMCQHKDHGSAVSGSRRDAGFGGHRIALQARYRHEYFGNSPGAAAAAQFGGEYRLYTQIARLSGAQRRGFAIPPELENARHLASRAGPHGLSKPLPRVAGGAQPRIRAHGAPGG